LPIGHLGKQDLGKQDHVEGFTLVQPQDDTGDVTVPRDAEWPNHIPYHPSFGHQSGVKVPVPGEMMMEKDSGRNHTVSEFVEETAPRRTGRDRGKTKLTTHQQDEPNQAPTRRVQDRWFYETVPAILAQTANGVDSVTIPIQELKMCVRGAPCLQEDNAMDKRKGSAKILSNTDTSEMCKSETIDCTFLGKTSSPVPENLGILGQISPDHLDEITND
jgi:hypothetical protein